jgi:DNA repair protein RadC
LPQNRQIAITTIASGGPTPSQPDIHIIKAIVQIANPLRISGHDHIIVGKNGHAGLKGLQFVQRCHRGIVD